ncbi:MAG TPA: VWA domain-containing protein [Thermoanaerobaculia bacterium]|nr:VWA domain-containing protein [Thermoanaerobaculia bacterium]
MKKLVFACALALAAGPALGAETPAPSPFGERVDVNIVNVEVWVTDRDGNPVNGLQRGDFEIREDGKPVGIANFEAFAQKVAAPSAATPEARKTGAAPEAIHLVIYVDNTFLLPAHRNRVLRQLRDFIARLSPADEVMLVTEDPALKVRQAFTRDRAALLRTVDEVEKSASTGVSHASAKAQAIDTIFNIREVNAGNGQGNVPGTPCPPDLVQPARSYADVLRADVLRSLGAMTVLVNSLSGVPGRKALLLVSDGMPVTPGEEIFQILVEMCHPSGTSGSRDAEIGGTTAEGDYDASQAALDAQSYDTSTAFRAFTAHANAQRVTLYTLEASGLAGSAASAAEIGPRERILQLPGIQLVETSNLQNSLFVLASDTGGRAILNANDLTHDLTHIQEDFATYYSLAYSPPHSGDGHDHRIEVRVKRPGVKVRYRQSYRDKPALERTVDRTLASLLYGYEDNPLEIQAEIGDAAPLALSNGKSATWSVPVRLRIPLFRVTMLPTETSFEGKLRLLVATANADGKRSPVRQVQVPIHIPRLSALTALGQYYQYEVKLNLESGEQHLAIAVRDEATTTTSFIARTLKL